MWKGIVKILIAGLIGGGGFFLAGYGSQKIATLQKYPLTIPAIIFGVALLFLRRGRMGAAYALAGLAGAIAILQWQMKAAGGQSAGLNDAGRRDSGLYDRPANAGALFGMGGQKLLEQQNAMGGSGNQWGDAGALFGFGAREIMNAQNAMGG